MSPRNSILSLDIQRSNHFIAALMSWSGVKNEKKIVWTIFFSLTDIPVKAHIQRKTDAEALTHKHKIRSYLN